jgi:hypothetical protein
MEVHARPGRFRPVPPAPIVPLACCLRRLGRRDGFQRRHPNLDLRQDPGIKREQRRWTVDPIYIILYVVVVPLVITLVFARQRPLSPNARRRLWILLAAGVLVFLVLTYIVLGS